VLDVDTWTEIVNPSYYAAFSWALLDAVADTSSNPPKLRPVREIKCFTQVESEAVSDFLINLSFHFFSLLQSMVKAYMKDKKLRTALSIQSEWLSRVPDVIDNSFLFHVF
jgi:hypothetical protein